VIESRVELLSSVWSCPEVMSLLQRRDRMHAFVWSMFREHVERPFIYAVDGNIIRIRSTSTPSTPRGCRMRTGKWAPNIGRRGVLSGTINAVVQKNGRKHGLVSNMGDSFSEEGLRIEVEGYFNRRADRTGIVMDTTLNVEPSRHILGRQGRRPIVIEAVTFRSTVSIVDKAKALATLSKGIGSCRSFGFGLMDLEPMHKTLDDPL